MRGAAASSAVHRSSAGAKHHAKTGAEHVIEAGDDIGTFVRSGEKDEEKEVDPDYDEEQDHLYLFPPPKYHKGDRSLGVLMSG